MNSIRTDFLPYLSLLDMRGDRSKKGYGFVATGILIFGPILVGAILFVLGLARGNTEIGLVQDVTRGIVSTSIISLWLGLTVGIISGTLLALAAGFSAGLSPQMLMGDFGGILFVALTGLVTGALLSVSAGDIFPSITKWWPVIKSIVAAVFIIASVYVLSFYLAAILLFSLEVELERSIGVYIGNLEMTTLFGIPLSLERGIRFGLAYLFQFGLWMTLVTALCVYFKTRHLALACLYGISIGPAFGIAEGFTGLIDEGIRFLADGIRESDVSTWSLKLAYSMIAINKSLGSAIHFVTYFSITFLLVKTHVNEKLGLLAASILTSLAMMNMSGSLALACIVYPLCLFVGKILSAQATFTPYTRMAG